jgi:DNA-binding IclR family transcriptional regulator
MRSLPAQPNRSLIDGLEVVRALAMASEPIGSRQIARQLQLEPTRANRLLKTLASTGIASQTTDRRYRPGPGMHVLAAQALRGSGLLRRAVPLLQSVARDGLVVAMGTVWRGQVCYLYHASPGTAPADALGHRPAFPAWQSGVGVAALSSLPADQVREHLHSIASRDERARLRTLIDQARAQQFACVNQPEQRIGLAVGIAQTGVAVGVSGRIGTRQIAPLVRQLNHIAHTLAAEES